MTWVFSWKINLYPNSEPYFVMAMNINERIQMPIKLLCGALVLLAFSDLAACGEREIERDTCPRQAQQFARIQDQGQRKDARAQTALASCYELGMHVKPSRQQAIHWLKLAAEQDMRPPNMNWAEFISSGAAFLLTTPKLFSGPGKRPARPG